MSETTIETVRTMLESVLEETDDPESRFKLRTALQLLVVIEEGEAAARKALGDAALDESVREDLRDLGYLE